MLANVLTELITSLNTNFNAVNINAPSTQLPRIGVNVSEKNLTYLKKIVGIQQIYG